MKPICSGEIMLFIIGASLSIRILDMILNLKLANDIGMYCPTLTASGTLGIRMIVLALKLGKIQSLVKNSKTAFVTSIFTIF